MSLILLAAILAAGCGYFETDEPHLTPRTPLLPPTTEDLGAPLALTPTSAPPPTAADAQGADEADAPPAQPAEGEAPVDDESPGGAVPGGAVPDEVEKAAD